jgi:uncharacterized protein YjdB
MQRSHLSSLFVLVLVLVAAILNTSCGGVTAAASAPVNAGTGTVSILVNPATVTLQVGATQQFAAAVTGNSDTAVTWSASGGTISVSGLYTAPASSGTFTVTATSSADSTKSSSATVTVTAAPSAVSISVNPVSASISPGGSQQFTASVTGTTNTAVTWTATSGTMSTSGMFTAPASAGTYTVRATSVADNSKSASATVTVTAPPPVVGIVVAPGSASLQTGGAQQFTATITGTTNTAVTWTATGGTVSAAGLYTAPTTAGTYSVRATSVADTSKFATANITVVATPPPVVVAVSPTSASVQTGATRQFAATVTGSSNTAVTWTTTGGTVSTTGLFTAPATAGTFTVRATSVADGTKSATATVTVTVPLPVVSVSVSPTSASLQTGATQQLTATVTGSSNAAVNWTSTAGTVSASGLYTAPATAGTYTVTATSSADTSKSASSTITVTAPPPIVVTMSPPSVALQTSATQQFTASITGTSNTAVTWTATAGTVSAAGLYTAPATAGTYTVRATSVADPSKFAVATVTVTATPPPVGVTVSPTTASLQTGATQQFTANVTGTSNTAVTWTATGGTVSAAGLYTAPATAGTYTVTATSIADTMKSDSSTVTVTAPPPVVVTVNPTSASLQTGATQQFTSTVTGTGNSAVTWSATGGTISTAGLYTAPATAGIYTVRATSTADTSKSAAATVTVTTAPAQIGVSPALLSFGSIVANTTSTQNVTVSNTGGTSLSVTSATVTGAAFSTVSATFPFTIAAGASASLTIRFAPTAAGNFTGSLTVSSNAPNTPLAISLSGTATAPPTLLLSASPTSVNFGSILVGNNSSQSITLSNTGNTAVSVSAANFTGGVFSTNLTFPTSVAAGATRSVTLTFAPDVSGPFSGSVSFVSNASNSPAAVSLSGTGVAPVAHSVDLSWIGSTSSGVVGYFVYRGLVNGGPYSKINSSAEPTTTYSDSSVQSGLTYYYVVTAVDGAGAESAFSNQSTAIIPTP